MLRDNLLVVNEFHLHPISTFDSKTYFQTVPSNNDRLKKKNNQKSN